MRSRSARNHSSGCHNGCREEAGRKTEELKIEELGRSGSPISIRKGVPVRVPGGEAWASGGGGGGAPASTRPFRHLRATIQGRAMETAWVQVRGTRRAMQLETCSPYTLYEGLERETEQEPFLPDASQCLGELRGRGSSRDRGSRSGSGGSCSRSLGGLGQQSPSRPSGT
jgi:hypothetical protein